MNLTPAEIGKLKLILTIISTNPTSISPDNQKAAKALNDKITLPKRTTPDPR